MADGKLDILESGWMAKSRSTNYFITDKSGHNIFRTEKGLRASICYNSSDKVAALAAYDIFPVVVIKNPTWVREVE